jgi:hypothetical protein
MLASFTAAINEEQAWALTYQSARAAQALIADPSVRDLVLLTSNPEQILVQRDGHVHKDTFLDQQQGNI